MTRYLRVHRCLYILLYLTLMCSCLHAQDDDPRRFSYQLAIRVDARGPQGKSTKKNVKRSDSHKDKDDKSVKNKAYKEAAEKREKTDKKQINQK